MWVYPRNLIDKGLEVTMVRQVVQDRRTKEGRRGKKDQSFTMDTGAKK